MRTRSLRDHPKEFSETWGKRKDFASTCCYCEKEGHRTFEVVSVISKTTHGASAIGVQIPGVLVDMAGENDSVVKIAFRNAKKNDEGIKVDTYHEGNGTKLEFERSIGVFVLMIELPIGTWFSVRRCTLFPSFDSDGGSPLPNHRRKPFLRKVLQRQHSW